MIQHMQPDTLLVLRICKRLAQAVADAQDAQIEKKWQDSEC